jgi:ketosteroid isomerase-like protein
MKAGPNLEAIKREILSLHEADIKAHLDKDVDHLVQGQSTSFVSVHSGEIRRPTPEETRAALARYLGSTTFTEYRDLVEPVVGVSPDGSTAWSIVQVRVTGAKTGGEPIDFTCAWITLYERQGGAWKRIVEASTFKQ